MLNEQLPTGAAGLKDTLAQALQEQVRPGFGRCLATDEVGRLFDPNFRAMLGRSRKLDAGALSNIEAVAAMGTAAKAMQQFFEDELDAFGISHAQYKVLVWIQNCGEEGTHLNAIADSLRVTPRNVTGLIDSLEAQGLVERVPDPRDRRATVARLTPAGETTATDAWRTHQRNIQELLSVLDEDEKAVVRDVALKLIRALETHPVGTPSGPNSRRKPNG